MSITTAIKLYSENKNEEAREILMKLVAENPDDSLINFYCGCVYDSMGLEHNAAPFYEIALANGISNKEREQAYIQLGSTYRCIGQFSKALNVLEKGIKEFPDNNGIKVFYAMTLHNLNRHSEATSIFIQLLSTSSDPWITSYKRALSFYSEHIDETF